MIPFRDPWFPLSCLDRDDDVDSNYSPTKLEIFGLNQSLDASAAAEAAGIQTDYCLLAANPMY